MIEEKYKSIIDEYIKAYNCFDIDKMVENFCEDVVFINVSDNHMNLSCDGIEKYKDISYYAKSIFEARHLEPVHYKQEHNRVFVDIEFEGIISKDLSDEFKTGDELLLCGTTIFEFSEDKISVLLDFS